MNKSKKRKLTVVLSVILVAVIAIGGTTAYLFSQTNAKENVFSFSDNIKGYLDEPNWDPDKGENLYPGLKIDKDPQIMNTSKNYIDEYASIRLTFKDGAGNTLSPADTVKLLNLIEIDWGGNWELINGTLDVNTLTGEVTDATAVQIWAFNEPLSQGVTSDPLFYSVTIKGTVTPDELAWLSGIYNHDDDCYTFGTHDDDLCTVTYRHHERCAIYGMTDAETVPAGGTLDVYTCDCKASEIHERACPSLIGVLNGSCSHTLQGGLGGFIIFVEGGVVQADAFTDLDDAKQALIDVFTP